MFSVEAKKGRSLLPPEKKLFLFINENRKEMEDV
jgi:hypothetical protein